jgi:hypothetical protein
MKFKYIVIVISLVSLFVLYLLSTLSQPTTISLSLVPFNEGKEVVVKGIVTNYQTTTYGSQLISIRDVNSTNESTIILYIEGEFPVEYGDIIQANGIVQQYNNNWELTVSNPRFIIVLQRWGDRPFPVWQLAQNPTKYVDTNVNVTGLISTLSSSSFYLHDTEGNYVLPVSFPHSSESLFSQGDLVAVKARFLYNQETFSYQLKVADTTQGIIVLQRGNNA